MSQRDLSRSFCHHFCHALSCFSCLVLRPLEGLSPWRVKVPLNVFTCTTYLGGTCSRCNSEGLYFKDRGSDIHVRLNDVVPNNMFSITAGHIYCSPSPYHKGRHQVRVWPPRRKILSQVRHVFGYFSTSPLLFHKGYSIYSLRHYWIQIDSLILCHWGDTIFLRNGQL